jgi:hypothetical protein
MRRRGLDVRLRLRAHRACRAAWRFLRQQYLSFASLAIIGGLFALVMTSDSFTTGDRPPPVQAVSQAGPRPPQQRFVVQFFVVRDEEQLRTLSTAVGDDQGGRAELRPNIDHVVYLLAGTEEEEAAAIRRLNFESQLAQESNVDLRVIDVRGRFPR